ncbi:MAG: Mut7-C RNAse domain-containing protein [Brevinematia bacterium]
MIVRFVADSMLGGLAKYLRMLGFHTEYFAKIEDKELIKIIEEDKKAILLTKDRHLKDEYHTYGNRIFLVTSEDKIEQTVEVLKTFKLKNQISPFIRCLECNTKLIRIPKKEAEKLLSQEICKNFSEFYKCPVCNKIFWFSTHTQRMEIIIQRILNKLEEK